MQHQAVLFDLDGTLIDSLQDLASSTNRTLQAHGFPPHPVDAYKYFVGDGARNLILRALPEPSRADTDLVDRVLEAYTIDYGRNWNCQTCLYPGIAEMLDGLVQRHIRLALLSNKPNLFTQACAQAYLSAWKFDVVMGASSVFPHKPHPAAALDVARQMALAPAQFLYLGDTSTDMQTARNAGMTAVGATWGFRLPDELLASGAQRLIDHPAQLLDLIG
jgi:phosphoglycolate phosphatase